MLKKNAFTVNVLEELDKELCMGCGCLVSEDIDYCCTCSEIKEEELEND